MGCAGSQKEEVAGPHADIPEIGQQAQQQESTHEQVGPSGQHQEQMKDQPDQERILSVSQVVNAQGQPHYEEDELGQRQKSQGSEQKKAGSRAFKDQITPRNRDTAEAAAQPIEKLRKDRNQIPGCQPSAAGRAMAGRPNDGLAGEAVNNQAQKRG